jgi:hypothetical protein
MDIVFPMSKEEQLEEMKFNPVPKTRHVTLNDEKLIKYRHLSVDN